MTIAIKLVPEDIAGNLALNKELAALLGWKDVFEIGGALMGTPKHGAENSRGQALVPDWVGDWAACGPLMADFGIYISRQDVVQDWMGLYPYPDILNIAMRKAIVRAAIKKLKEFNDGLNKLKALRATSPHTRSS